MGAHLAHAFTDFREFLSGRRAPALIPQSLATVVVQEPADVAAAVREWAYAHPDPDGVTSVLTARDKVFDIFFYRVVRFRRVFDFFDAFEQALVGAVPPDDRLLLAQRLAEAPWREIRPLGSFRDPLEYALAKRRRAAPRRDRFNDDVYRNATHQILSVDRRHSFADQRSAELVAGYQGQLAGVFDDFVGLIQDPQQRREIMLANAADRHATYEVKPAFDVTGYVSNLMEFVIALLNDDFFEHGMQVLGVVRQIHRDFKLDVAATHWQRFRSHADLIDPQRLAEFSADPARAVLLRQFLPLFERWTPPRLLETVRAETDRRSRKLAVSLLEAYGPEVYELVVRSLAAFPPSTSWYFERNLAYLLARVVTGSEPLKHAAVGALAPRLAAGGPRPLSLAAVAALGAVGTPEAERVLVAALGEYAKKFSDPESAEVCHKILAALFGIGSDGALEAAAGFCLARGLVGQYRDELAAQPLPAHVRALFLDRVRKELRRLRFSGSLLGNAAAASALLAAVGHPGSPDVEELCRHVVAVMPARHALADEAAAVLAAAPPARVAARDRRLRAYLARPDLLLALCHAYDAGTSGHVHVETRDGVRCHVELSQGRVIAAGADGTFVEHERALFWIAMLEPREIAAVRFHPAGRLPSEVTIKTPTSELLTTLVFQRAEVRRIADAVVSPDARFKRREVNPIYTDFSRLRDPRKYAAVWEALAEESDLRQVAKATGLSRHDVFRVLLYFHRRNMLAADVGRRDSAVARVADALATVDVYLRRIEQRPLQLRFYQAAGEGCAFLERHAPAEALRSAAAALGAHLLEAHGRHRPFAEDDVAICRRAIELMTRYHRGGNAADREALVQYVRFAFAAAAELPVGGDLITRSPVEQLENIEFCNDAFEPPRGDAGGQALGELVGAASRALEASGVSLGALAEGGTPTAAESKIILEVFGGVAAAHATTKPLKDFARELRRAMAAGEPVAGAWVRVIEPSLTLLGHVAGAVHCREAESALTAMRRELDDLLREGGREVPWEFCARMLAAHDRLARLLPLAFALELTEDQLAAKRSALLATLVLRQVEGVTDLVLDRLTVAGFTDVEAFLEVVPEDIAVAAGIDPGLAETIFLKFFQYQDLYDRTGDPAASPKYAAMFDIGLTALKESCVELERIAYEEHVGRDVEELRKAGLLAARQRALASLLALLCLRGQFDRVEAIQLVPYDKRVLLLDEYYSEITEAPPAPRRADAAS